MIKRLFIALEIPSEIKKAIIEQRDSVLKNEKFRWEPIEKLHITLKFLGDVEIGKIDSIEEIILDNVTKNKISEIYLSKFDFFFRGNKPIILWAGFKENQSLNNFVNSLNSDLSKIHFDIETRKFNPHLTLLRIKNDFSKSLIDKFQKRYLNELSFIPVSITLYESNLEKSGAAYTAIKKINL